MGYFTSNPVNAVNDPTRLSDLDAQFENAMELKRSFARYHSFVGTGGNDGEHKAISYVFLSGKTLLAKWQESTEVFRLGDSAYFDGAIWRGTFSVMAPLAGGSIGGHCVFYFAGAISTAASQTGSSLFGLDEEADVGFNYKGAGAVSSSYHLAKVGGAPGYYAQIFEATDSGSAPYLYIAFLGGTGSYGVGEESEVEWFLQLTRLCPAP